MYSDFIPFTPSSSEREFQRAGVGRAAAKSYRTPTSASIDDKEWRSVIDGDEYQRAFVELSAAFYADYGRVLDQDSWAGLRRFLKRCAMRVPPTMGAESTGRIVATWRMDDEALSIEFIDRFKLKFAVTAKSADVLRRKWGTAHALTLLDAEPMAARFLA